MGRWVVVEEGVIDIEPRYKGDRIRDHILPGTFPRRYWDIAFLEEDEIARMNKNEDLSEPEPKCCKRCNRPIKAQYTHCYHCWNYVQKKARIAAEMRIA